MGESLLRFFVRIRALGGPIVQVRHRGYLRWVETLVVRIHLDCFEPFVDVYLLLSQLLGYVFLNELFMLGWKVFLKLVVKDTSKAILLTVLGSRALVKLDQV